VSQETLQVDDLSLFKPINTLLRARGLLLFLPLALVAAGAGWTAYAGAPYLATSSFMPAAGTPSMTLAAQFGLTAATGGVPPLQLYADLMQSREILERVATSTYSVPEGAASGRTEDTFMGWVEIEGDSAQERLHGAVEQLREIIKVDVNDESGVITVRVPAGLPRLAEGLNRRILDLLSEFNVARRQTQARAEREFVQAQLAVARDSLRLAEDELRRFLEVNRSYRDSPRLAFEASRLEREVTLRQSLVATLSEAYAKATIDEVRDTPVFTIIDAPEGSAVRELPWLRNALLGAIAGFGMAVFVAFWREYRHVQEVLHRQDVAEFDRLTEEMRSGLGGLLGRSKPRTSGR
jgi:uncharacterized protein involved in exopolysaccharide biosynthesis